MLKNFLSDYVYAMKIRQLNYFMVENMAGTLLLCQKSAQGKEHPNE